MGNSQTDILEEGTEQNKIVEDNNFSDYLNNFGAFFHKDGDIDSAVKSLLLSYSITGNRQALLALVEIYVELRMFESAIELINGHIGKNPDDFEFYKFIPVIEEKKSLFETKKEMGIGEFSKLNLDPILCFVHTPKAGGTTFWNLLYQEMSNSCRIHKRIDCLAHLHEFVSKDMPVKRNYDLMGGHVAFGLHNHIDREMRYITMLREPTERAISNYYYVLTHSRNEFHKILHKAEVGLSKYVKRSCKYGAPYNFQLLTITDIFQKERLDLELGKRNLVDKFLFVGIMEQFDESLIILKKKLEWKVSPFYTKRNVTKARPAINEVDSSIKDMIKENNSLDYDLYSFAKELFEKEKTKYGENFEKDVEEFKYFNRLYNEIVQ